MNMKISPAVAVIIVVIVVGIAVAVGFKAVSGGPDADVTQQVIAHYNQAKTTPPPAAPGMNSRRDSGAGSPTVGGTDSNAGGKQYH